MSFDPATQPVDEIEIGQLRHRITIQTPQVTGQDSTGAELISWVEFAQVWANVMPIGGREIFAAAQIYPDADTRIIMRWRSDLDPKMRIWWPVSARPSNGHDRQFDILNISDINERHHEIEIIALERPIERNP
jgi:SPP1 family predicted phage head-tail adaptor